MRIVIVTHCRNHAAVVERSIENHLALCDAIVAVDRNSIDGTRDILADLEERGWPVVVFDDPRLGIDEALRRRRLHQNASRHFRPDWIVETKADELLSFENREALEHALTRAASPGDAGATSRSVPALARTASGMAQSTWGQGRDSNILPATRIPSRTSTDQRLEELLQRIDRSFERLTRVEADKARASLLHTSVTRNLPAYVVDHLARSLRQSVAPGSDGIQHRARLSSRGSAGPQISESGALGLDFHDQHPYVDLPPFRYCWDRFRPHSVLDVGCGGGVYLREFRSWGADDVLGIDDYEGLERNLPPETHRRGDLRSRIDLGRRYALVVCTEVLEHIDRSFEDVVIDTLIRHAERRILFSAARPGQPGAGHVNCRPPSFWVEAFRRRGWTVEPFESLAVRALSTFYWFRRNLMVLAPRGDHSISGAFTAADLESIEARLAPWLGEAPARYTFPLSVELPELAPTGEPTG